MIPAFFMKYRLLFVTCIGKWCFWRFNSSNMNKFTQKDNINEQRKMRKPTHYIYTRREFYATLGWVRHSSLRWHVSIMHRCVCWQHLQGQGNVISCLKREDRLKGSALMDINMHADTEKRLQTLLHAYIQRHTIIHAHTHIDTYKWYTNTHINLQQTLLYMNYFH